MCTTFTRSLRIPSPLHEAVWSHCAARPGEPALLVVDSRSTPGVGAEMLVRALLPAGTRGDDVEPARRFLLGVDAAPAAALSRWMRRVLDGGYAGAAFLPPGVGPAPGAGLVRASFHGAHWLDAVQVVGPGLRRVRTTLDTGPAAAPAGPAGVELAALRVAVAGAELASHVALELVHAGARALSLLDDGGRVHLGTLGLLAEAEPEDLGEFRCDAVASRLRRRWQVAAGGETAAADGIAAALDRLQPDLVVGCEADPARRAAVAAWCADRLRVLVEIVPEVPPTRPGLARASVRSTLPGAVPDAEAAATMPWTADLFDDLPTPDAGGWLGGLGRHDLATTLALYPRAARAATAALLGLVRGRLLPDLEVRTTLLDDGRIVGSACEGPAAHPFAAACPLPPTRPAAAVH